jgi:hypothetical protein
MRWTRWHQLTSDADADGKIVWSCPPDAGVKPCEDVSQGDGGNKARFTGESAYKPLKPIAQGRPDCFGGPVVATRVLSTFAHEAAGAQNTRSSLRPLFLPRDNADAKTRANHAAGTRRSALSSSLRGAKRRSNPDCICGGSLDCFAFARNDELT